MSTPFTPAAGNKPDESLAEPVGGNALNKDGQATENPDKFGAGTPEGEPDSNTNEEVQEDATELVEDDE
jgi:hypothetical protein